MKPGLHLSTLGDASENVTCRMARLRIFFHLFLLNLCTLGQNSRLSKGDDSEEQLRDTSTLLRSLNLPQRTEYEIVSPYEVTHEGIYISHEVSHHQRRRRVRSLNPDSGSSWVDKDSQTVHFQLSGLGQEFHMELREASDSLIAPGFSVQVLGKNGTKSLRAYHRDNLCFYQGSLRGRVNTSVALSTCLGMSGLIRTQDADYFLRPVSHSLAQGENFTARPGHQPHILYKSYREPPTETEPKYHNLQKRSLHSVHEARRTGTHEDQLNRRHSHNRHRHRQRQHFCGRRKKCIHAQTSKGRLVGAAR